MAYFPDGTIMKTGAFYDGLPSGSEISYYPNGKMYKIITYLPNARFSYDELRDSTGKVLAAKGTGEWLEFDASFTDTLKKGRISKGDKTGIWDEKQGDNIKFRKDNTKDAKTPAEYWCKINGVSFVKLDEPPTFRGGMEAFGRYLGKTIRYPAYARGHSIQGKVLIAFKVNEKGELSDLVIKQSIWKDMDEEALRAVKLSSPWKPAMIGGRPVSVPFSVPINFALASD